MHKLRGVARRRTARLAAGLVLTAGVAGGVLLTSGAAYAATATITITGATPSQGFGGTNLDVQVSTTGGTGGSFSVSGAGSGCSGFVNPMSGSGSCDIHGVPAGSYSLVASYQGASSSAFPVTVAASTNPNPGPTNPGPTNPGPTNPGPTNPGPTNPGPSNPTPTGDAPSFSTDAAPTSVNGQSYSYQFQASNSPSFELVGAPGWLSIGPDGFVSGNIPPGTTSFSYSVKAWNNFGWVTAGPFNVFFRNNFFRHEHVNLTTSLGCTSPVYTGRHGTCTLTVNNTGGGFAPDVTAQINLPWQLRADYCGYYQFWNWSSNQYWNNFYNNGCSISGNTVSESLGSLYPWQSKELTVTFTAQSGYGIFGRHHGWNDTVQVTGSASSGFNNFYGNYNWDYQFWGQRQNYSVAYVTIIPRGFWW
jgi:hypothetical protein